ncbi:MAG TPA: VOC family protein [Micromonosporaceae bacterium]|nr:VOC family protein [Micromonosporaceae bacterium]
MGSRWYAVVVAATDPARLARWWAEVLDYRIAYEKLDEVGIESGTGPALVFALEQTAKTAKNRLHFDLDPDDQEAEVERLVNMGARRVDVGQGDGATWVVLADPEGNEFCLLPARAR